MHPSLCPNCSYDNAQNTAFCAQCGQKNTDYRRPLPPMVGQLIQEAFEVDGRVVQSLKLLFFKPGALTVAFSENRRASFVSPIRLYLFSSLLFFFVLSVTADLPDIQTVDPNTEISVETDENISDDDIGQFKQAMPDELGPIIDDIMLRQGQGAQILKGIIDDFANPDTQTTESDEPPPAHSPASGPSSTITLSAPQKFIYEQLVRSLDDPENTIRTMLENAPIALFFLLPAYTVLLKLVYIRHNKFFVEHFVFALHLHTFALLIFTLMTLLRPDSSDSIEDAVQNVLWTSFLIYYFFALKNYYGQGKRRTLFKYVSLLGFYSMLLIPAILFVMLFTVSFM